jgi:AraC family transcriptional regulator, alkane utilization regulator
MEKGIDILSDTLRVVRLTGAVFFNATLTAPWAFESPSPEVLRAHFRSDSECLMLFHIVEQGTCWITLEDGVSFLLRKGDAVILPHSDVHLMSSARGPSSSHVLPIEALTADAAGGVATIAFGGDGEPTRVVCGYLQCDQKFNPMVSSLPSALWLRHGVHLEPPPDSSQRALAPWCIVPVVPGEWLEVTILHALEATSEGKPGATAMLSRLSEVMFVEVLQRFIAGLPQEFSGWMAAVRDRNIGQALQAMHTNPERPWTVEGLASVAAMSRSGLAQRFTDLVGETPMQYLTGWRMQLAKYLLRQTNMTITEIATRTGYASEVAFHRAFKRVSGEPPVQWRRRSASGT